MKTSRTIRAARQAKETHKWANPGAHHPGNKKAAPESGFFHVGCEKKAARPGQVETPCNSTRYELSVQPSREGLPAQPA